MNRRLQIGLGGAVLAIAFIVVAADAHDLFLRPRDFLVKPGSQVDVRVLNGTFASSEAVVTADRLRDLTIVGPEGVSHPDRSTWNGTEKESSWRVRVGETGTYLLGASLLPRTIRLTGAQFNDYLREDGLPDELDARRASGSLEKPAHERYSKHVKALVRADGRPDDVRSTRGDSAFAQVLGYPAEIVPLEDPYQLHAGAALRVHALVDGAPVAHQVVLAGGRTARGALIPERAVRTDHLGVARIALRTPGVWYVKFIRMRSVPAAAGDSVDYESKWATLTFAVRPRAQTKPIPVTRRDGPRPASNP